MGFCIGGSFIWNLLRRAPDRIVAAVLAQPSGFRPEVPDLFYQNNSSGWGPALCRRRPDITMSMIDAFLTKMYRSNADFVFTVTRDFGSQRVWGLILDGQVMPHALSQQIPLQQSLRSTQGPSALASSPCGVDQAREQRHRPGHHFWLCLKCTPGPR